MEACGIWYPLYDYLRKRCNRVAVANPIKTELIGLSKKKTDKIDAKKLADLLRSGMMPESFIPERHAREFRKKIRHRQSTVRLSTLLKNKVHSILRYENIKHPGTFKETFLNE